MPGASQTQMPALVDPTTSEDPRNSSPCAELSAQLYFTRFSLICANMQFYCVLAHYLLTPIEPSATP